MPARHDDLGKLGCHKVPWRCDCNSTVTVEALGQLGLVVTVTSRI